MPLELQFDDALAEIGEAIFENCAIFITMLDEKGEIIVASKKGEELFGYFIRGELIGRSIDQLVPERLREVHEKKHRAEFNKKPNARQMGERGSKLTGLRKDGTEFPAEVTLVPRMVRGEPCLIVLVADMSTRIELEHGQAETQNHS